MKPIKAADTGSDAPAVPPSFLDSLKAIDVSSLERLIAIRQENERIAQYRAKADAKKKDVAEAVYARVSQDYAKRAAALEQQSAPLRTQARAEYRKLLLWDESHTGEAIKEQRKVVAENPKDLDAKRTLALLLARQDPNSALIKTALEDALEQAPAAFGGKGKAVPRR